jgi:acetyl esterase
MKNKYIYDKYIQPEYGELSKEVYLEHPIEFDANNITKWRNDYNYKVQNLLTNYWINRRVFSPLMDVQVRNEIVSLEDYKLPLKIYTPAKTGVFPVLIFYHGGGFMMNTPEIYDLVHRYLSYFGDMIVVAPDYRLAPENKFPLGLNDSYKTLEWVEENMKAINGNNQITVCGDSSGGNFATVVSMMARDLGGPSINKQILIYPCVYIGPQEKMSKSEILYGKGYELDFDDIKNIIPCYLKNENDWENPYVSPILGNVEKLPDAYFISGECDTLLDQGLMYATKLKESKVKVTYDIYKGMPHAFINRPYQRTFDALDNICKIVNSNI